MTLTVSEKVVYLKKPSIPCPHKDFFHAFFSFFFFKVPNAFHGDDLLYNHVREPQIEVPMYYGGPMIIFGTSDEILFP